MPLEIPTLETQCPQRPDVTGLGFHLNINRRLLEPINNSRNSFHLPIAKYELWVWIVISILSSSTLGARIKPSVSLLRESRDTKCSSSVRSLIRVKGMSNIYGCDVCAVEFCCSYMTSPGSRKPLTLSRFRPTLSPHHEPILEINLSDGFSNLLYSAVFFSILTPMSGFFCPPKQ